MKETSVTSAPVVQPEPQFQPQPEPKVEKPVTTPPAMVQAPAPVKTSKHWSPTVKFKVGSGWAKQIMPLDQNWRGRVDFFSLIHR